MAGSVAVEGWEPGAKVEVYPAHDLVPRGRAIKTVTASKSGTVTVDGLKPGNYFLDTAGRRVQARVPDSTFVVPEPVRLSPEEIRERLAQTRPEQAAPERVESGARTTASRPRRSAASRKPASRAARSSRRTARAARK